MSIQPIPTDEPIFDVMPIEKKRAMLKRQLPTFQEIQDFIKAEAGKNLRNSTELFKKKNGVPCLSRRSITLFKREKVSRLTKNVSSYIDFFARRCSPPTKKIKPRRRHSE